MVEIIPFEPRYRDAFKRLNIAWLEKYFRVEPLDEEVLSDPETRILGPGGHILFARQGEGIVGACALMHEGGGRFELSKMAVDERHQGLGLGRRLLEAAVAKFKELGGTELFLESNSRLAPAIRLYETSGFRHAPRPGASHYERADVYMVYEG
ncbi:MAG TPA: GNAT family N-acetyltransferase [Holophagaceae bacterium]|jgi:GNAT superfamily N-acetyltransferase|nr:GNAT family N-acetyltransferase [Holophagaceae bacterium]